MNQEPARHHETHPEPAAGQQADPRSGAAGLPATVPATISVAGETITVERAWPRSRREDSEVLLVEGLDRHRRVRAAELRLRPTGELDWQVVRQRLAPAGQDPKLAELAAAARGGTVVVHRYGKRAVVRHADRYLKVVPRGTAPAVARSARQGEQVAHAAGFDAPQVLKASSGVVTFSTLPGRSLHELGGVVTTTQWEKWWQQWAGQWIELVTGVPGDSAAAADLSQRTDLPEHTAHDELSNLRRWLDRVQRFEVLPTSASHHLAARSERLGTQLLADRAEPLVISHRDLHDKQILAAVTPEGPTLGLLDFDTVSRAEPALDLANLWVHTALRADQGLWSCRHSETAGRHILGVADRLGVSRARLDAYAEATRVRLACLYAFRPRYRALALDWALTPRAV